MQDSKDNGKQGGLSWTTPAPAAQTQKPAPAAAPKPSSPAVKPPASSSSAKYIGMVVVGIIAGVVVAWAWVNFAPTASETATTGTQQNTTGNSTGTGANNGTVPAVGSDPGLSIMTPQPAGSSVAIDKAIVSAPTWVVIYEDKDGEPGNALGAALFFPERQRGTVELLRATLPGKSYLAVKQVDNGDRKFSLKEDLVLTEGGETQWVTFETR